MREEEEGLVQVDEGVGRGRGARSLAARGEVRVTRKKSIPSGAARSRLTASPITCESQTDWAPKGSGVRMSMNTWIAGYRFQVTYPAIVGSQWSRPARPRARMNSTAPTGKKERSTRASWPVRIPRPVVTTAAAAM